MAGWQGREVDEGGRAEAEKQEAKAAAVVVELSLLSELTYYFLHVVPGCALFWHCVSRSVSRSVRLSLSLFLVRPAYTYVLSLRLSLMSPRLYVCLLIRLYSVLCCVLCCVVLCSVV